MEEAMDRGWDSVGEKFACGLCLPEPDIAAFITGEAQSDECTYCKAKSLTPIAAHLDDIIGLIAESVQSEWAQAVEELPLENLKTGAGVFDGWDLISGGEIEIHIEDDQLREDISRAFGDQSYCRRGWAGDSEQEMLGAAWSRFVEVVKHDRRFFFDSVDEEFNLEHPWMSSTSPAEILRDLGALVVTVGLVKKLPAGTTFVRARAHDLKDTPKTMGEMGSPPVEFAKFPNRMSPAGVSMFYGALNEATAQAETVSDPTRPPEAITFARFETSRELRVLDLSSIPAVPSLFSPQRGRRVDGHWFPEDSDPRGRWRGQLVSGAYEPIAASRTLGP